MEINARLVSSQLILLSLTLVFASSTGNRTVICYKHDRDSESCPITNSNCTIILGYMTSYNTDFYSQSGAIGKVISGAMTLAVDTVNNRSDLLPGRYLTFCYYDTGGNEDQTLRGVTWLWRSGVYAFIGPDVTCTTEARLADAWNMPMVTYQCPEPAVSDKSIYSTFARTSPTAQKSTKSVVTLLKHFDWNFVSIISSNRNSHREVIKYLLDALAVDNITVQHTEEFESPLFSTFGPIPYDDEMHRFVNNTYEDTRIYIFLGDTIEWMPLMRALNTRGLLDNGEYLVITINLEEFSASWDGKLYWFDLVEMKEIDWYMKHTLWLFYTGIMNPEYDEFVNKATDRLQQEPFNVQLSPHFELPGEAAQLYDAVLLYAHALNKTIAEGGDERDGQAVMNNIFNSSYDSITGVERHVDTNGDSSANVTLYGIYKNITFEALGIFKQVNGEEMFSTYNGRDITWFAGEPPKAEPECGFKNDVPGTNGCVYSTIGVVLWSIHVLHDWYQT